MTKTVDLNVEMKCNGCAGAVQRILTKVPGVQTVTPSVETKKVAVVVDDNVEPSSLVDALKSWSEAGGKAVSLA